MEVKELDGSKYNTMMTIEATDGLEVLDINLDQLNLGDDSSDENGKLDPGQAKELLIADASAMTEMPVTANTLWVDDLWFTE